jgi:hypothetical protein
VGFASTAALRAFLDTGAMPARAGRLATFSDPALTAIPEDFATLTACLPVTQAAEAARPAQAPGDVGPVQNSAARSPNNEI